MGPGRDRLPGSAQVTGTIITIYISIATVVHILFQMLSLKYIQLFVTKSSFLTVLMCNIFVTLANSAYPDQTAH